MLQWKYVCDHTGNSDYIRPRLLTVTAHNAYASTKETIFIRGGPTLRFRACFNAMLPPSRVNLSQTSFTKGAGSRYVGSVA